MAGDWIKVETVTADKAEVHAVADALGISPDAAFGIIVRFWIWADQQTEDGYIPHAKPAYIDRIMQREGFAAAMVQADWLEQDSGGMLIPNFERHNGKSSKRRALSCERKRKERNSGKGQ